LRKCLRFLTEVNPKRRTVELHWKDDVVTVEKMVDYILEEPETDFQSDLLTLLDLQPDPANPVQQLQPSKAETKITNILLELSMRGENAVQKKLRKKWINSEKYQSCFGVDTSTTSRRVPIYKFPDSMISSASGSAMVDIVSTACPMVLELKSSKMDAQETAEIAASKNTNKSPVQIAIRDRELLTKEKELVYQLVERIFTMGRVNETLRRVIGFATSGRRSWALLLLRTPAQNGKWKLIERYYLCPIDTSQIVPLWHRLNCASLGNPAVHCQTHLTYPLAELLNSLGYHPGYCQVKWLKHSTTSDILKVIPGQLFPGAKEMSLPKSSSLTVMIVKFSVDDRGGNEVNVLNHLSAEGNICPAIQCVIATAQVKENVNQIAINRVNDTFLLKNHLNPNVAMGPKKKRKKDQEPPQEVRIEKDLSKNVAARFKDCYYCSSDLSGFASKESVNNPNQWWWNYCRDNTIIPRAAFTAVIMYTASKIAKDVVFAGNSYRNRLNEIHKFGVLHCDLRAPNCLYFDIPQSDDKNEISFLKTHYFITDFDLAYVLDKENEDGSVRLQLVPGERTRLIREFEKQQEEPLQQSIDLNDESVNWNKEIEHSFLFYMRGNIEYHYSRAADVDSVSDNLNF
jgi:serine/threonine protein kinase